MEDQPAKPGRACETDPETNPPLVVAVVSSILLVVTAALTAITQATDELMTTVEAVTLIVTTIAAVLAIAAVGMFPKLLNPWHHYAAVSHHHDLLMGLHKCLARSPRQADQITLALRIADHLEGQARHLAASRFARALTALPHPDELVAEAATWRRTADRRDPT